MFGITLNNMPEITECSVDRLKIQAPKGTITAFIRIKKDTAVVGYLAIKTERRMGRKLLEKAGFDAQAPDQEVNDCIKELCSMIAGFLKTELDAIGSTGIEITTPTVCLDYLNEHIEDVIADFRYVIAVFVKGFGQLIEAEVAFKN